jgi:hypothetical protein
VVIEDNGNLIVENGDGVLGNIKLDLREQLGLPRNQITSIRVGNIGLGIDADGVTANIISTFQTDQNLLLKPNGTGEVRTEKNFGAQSGSKVKFLSADNTNYLSLSGTQVGFTLNVNWAAEAPTPNQILQYKEVGVTNQPTFGWANVPTIADETTVNGVAKFSDEAGSLVSTAVLIDGTNNIISPSTITAAAFISGNLQIQNNRTIGTTANDLNISPNTNLNLNSNVYIGANNGGLDNRRTLYFFSSLNNTVGLAPPAAGDIAASIKFVLPAVIPAQTGTPAIDQNYVLKCNVTGAGVGTLSLTDLTAGTGTGISSEISSRADVTAGTERNRPVTPVNMGFHNGMVKAWCVFTANVTPIVLVGAYNANVVRAGVGHYTVTFGTTDMTAATYSVVMGYAAAGVIILRYVITNAHGFDIFAVDATNAAVDPTTISFQVCGFQ